MLDRLTGLIGIVVMVSLALAISTDRRHVPWRLVVSGVLLQFVLAFFLLVVPGTSDVFGAIAEFVVGMLGRADAGIAFVFGDHLVYDNPDTAPWGFIFAVKVLPIIIFFASLMAVLYYIGLMQRIIAALAWLLRKTMGVTGAEALATAANVFVGQTEAPLTVKPLIERMTRAQLMTLMVGGFATVAGSVLAAYIGFLGRGDPVASALFTKHLLTASVLSAPAALVMARIIIPEHESPPEEEHTRLSWTEGEELSNVFDAAASGATQGLKLALNVAAMLIAFLALLALINWPLEAISVWKPVAAWRAANGIPVLRLEVILGWILAPLAWTLGVGWHDATHVGSLLGQKIFLTELVAYGHLGQMLHPADPATPIPISERSAEIATYALCGFANFGSIAIQIGGLSAIAPGRRHDFARLALRAMIGGALASWQTAAIASLFIAK